MLYKEFVIRITLFVGLKVIHLSYFACFDQEAPASLVIITISLAIVEVRNCIREREGRNGGAALLKRGEATEDGNTSRSKVENPSRSEDLGMQRSDLRCISPPIVTNILQPRREWKRIRREGGGDKNLDLDERE